MDATDGRLHLAIRAGPTEAVAGDPVTVTATLENQSADRPTVTLLQSQPVMFTIEQLEGPVDMAPDRGPVDQLTLDAGAAITVPFAKAGGYDSEGPMATFWRDWFADPELRLPVGAYRITAITAYATTDGASTMLEASVDLAVASGPSAGASMRSGWEPIAVTPGRPEPRLLDVIPYGTGFLAAGTSGPRERWALWRSADGRTWERLAFPHDLPRDIRVRLAARGDEILVVAALLWSEEGDGELLAWSSPDGERWTRARLPGRHAALRDVGVIDGRWTVVGAWCMESCERWATWTSTDGRSWTRTDVPAETADGRIGEIFVGQDRLIGTATAIVDGSVTDWSVVASADGAAWDRIGRWPGVPDGWVRGVETSTGFVAVGLGEARGWLAVWGSPDAVDWTELHREPGRWGVETVTASGDAIVVGGLVLVDALADEDAPATLTTADGADWMRTVGAPFAALSYPQDVAINGDTVFLLTEDRPGEPSAWRAELGSP